MMEGFCSSYISGTAGQATNFGFTTQGNGGYISKMDVYFHSAITVLQKIKTVCALALLFGIDYLTVSTLDGYYCSDLMGVRLLQDKQTDLEDSLQFV